MPPKTRATGNTTTEPTKEPDSPSATANEPVPERPTETVDTPADQLEPVPDDVRQAALADAVARITEEYGPALDLLSRMDQNGTGPVRAIHPAFWAIMKDVQGVGKHGRMDPKAGMGNYQFRRYDDLKRELGAACRVHGVMLQSEIIDVVNERIDARKTRVQVTIRYRFTSLMDGSALAFESLGESIDTSDKATGKAMTMALKTALDQAFMLAAEDIDDPDTQRPDATADEAPALQRAFDQHQANPRFYREGDPVPPGGHQVGDQREVGGTTFTKHSDGPGYPNNAPGRTDQWDQGAPPPADDRRTPQQKAQAAADKVLQPGMTIDLWNKINEAAREQSLLDVVIRNSQGQEMALKHHLVAVGRTL